MTALNPFSWTGPIEDPVPRGPFTERVALALKAGTHVALFGPRGTGKTTFLGELSPVLHAEQGDDAPAWELVRIDLRRVLSLAAFVGAVLDGVDAHPSRHLRRKAKTAFDRVEKDIGINLGVVKAGIKTGRRQVNEAEILHAQLAAIAGIADRVVVAFDEFQRLNNCPGEPLSIIRSALMGSNEAGHLSLLLTGSMRERLELMLHSEKEPIWDQTLDLELPPIETREFIAYLEHRFEATGETIDERAIEHLVELTDAHPKRTQHLAWHVWDRSEGEEAISIDDVQDAFDELLAGGNYNSDFARVIDTLASGDDAANNEVRALFLLATDSLPGSDIDAQRYGLSDGNATARALGRLRNRGLVTERDGDWHIVDPLLAAWLRKEDPLSLN